MIFVGYIICLVLFLYCACKGKNKFTNEYEQKVFQRDNIRSVLILLCYTLFLYICFHVLFQGSNDLNLGKSLLQAIVGFILPWYIFPRDLLKKAFNFGPKTFHRIQIYSISSTEEELSDY